MTSFCAAARLVASTGEENANPALALLQRKGTRMKSRNLFAPKDTRQILIDQAELLRAQAEAMPFGVERDRLLKQVRQVEIQANLGSWVQSPGLQPPAR